MEVENIVGRREFIDCILVEALENANVCRSGVGLRRRLGEGRRQFSGC